MRKLWNTESPAKVLIGLAGAAREEGRFRDAAALYAEAVAIEPGRAPIHIQAGHMFKEAGELTSAESHYLAAVKLMPNDADLALQFGHFYKTAGRLAEANDAYLRAAALAPDWDEPRKELGNLGNSGWRPSGVPLERQDVSLGADDIDGPYKVLATAIDPQAIEPELLPRPASHLLHRSEPSTELRQFGTVLNTFWGMRRVARGIEAVRGFCLSTEPLTNVVARLNGLPIQHGALKGPYELEHEPDPERIHKYVFHLWCDFSRFVPGLHTLELGFMAGNLNVRTFSEDFVVEPPLPEGAHPDSDAVVHVGPGEPAELDDRINAQPSMIRPAERPRLLDGVRNILVIRPDQLGDVVTSVPALKRLRVLFPDARIVGLLGPANIDLANALGLFDETVVVDFRESMAQRKRTLSVTDQTALRDTLKPYRFDLAIDLSQSHMARPLLGLSGARFLYGFSHPDWRRLDASFDASVYDAKTRNDVSTHSGRMVALIDRLASLIEQKPETIRRNDLTRDQLAEWGLDNDRRFAVIHSGARIIFSRWPYFRELAKKLLDETDLTVVLFTADAAYRRSLPEELVQSDRVVIIDRQLSFDKFDAFLSFCSVYIGNDSGPKHLASLRGVPVVSIHSARISWREWGQEHGGLIISRRLPCAGCSIYHDVEECGKDFVCITAITLDDVYQAVRRYV